MTQEQIETQRVAGDITLILKNGTEDEKRSLLRVIEHVSGVEERNRIEKWMSKGMLDA